MNINEMSRLTRASEAPLLSEKLAKENNAPLAALTLSLTEDLASMLNFLKQNAESLQIAIPSFESLIAKTDTSGTEGTLGATAIDDDEEDIDFPGFDPKRPFEEEMKRFYKFLLTLSTMPNNINGMMALLNFLIGAESADLTPDQKAELNSYMAAFLKTDGTPVNMGQIIMKVITTILCYDAEGSSFEEKYKNAKKSLEALLSRFDNVKNPSPWLQEAKDHLKNFLNSSIMTDVGSFTFFLVPSQDFASLEQERKARVISLEKEYGSLITLGDIKKVCDAYYAARIKDIEKEAENQHSGYEMQRYYLLLLERSNDKDAGLGGLGDMLKKVQKLLNLYNEINEILAKNNRGTFTEEDGKKFKDKLNEFKTLIESNVQFKNIAPDLMKKIDEIFNLKPGPNGSKDSGPYSLREMSYRDFTDALNRLFADKNADGTDNTNAVTNRTFFGSNFQGIFATLTNLSQTTSSELQQRQAENQTLLGSVKALLDLMAKIIQTTTNNMRPS